MVATDILCGADGWHVGEDGFYARIIFNLYNVSRYVYDIPRYTPRPTLFWYGFNT
jgi:hypothetical protein